MAQGRPAGPRKPATKYAHLQKKLIKAKVRAAKKIAPRTTGGQK
ncbi:MAG: hypothetical protein WED34_10070 [Planctomycetales bacterium]